MPLNVGYLKAKTDKASDEVYTPDYAVLPLIKYIETFIKKENITIWCPFDTEESEYVKILSKIKHVSIIYTHIDNGCNFFDYEPEEYDLIISNPPFSIKDDIIKRLDELDKPYAILLPLPSLQGKKRFEYIKNCQALIFDERINYYTTPDRTEIQKGVSFASFYLCKNFLPKDLIFERLKK